MAAAVMVEPEWPHLLSGLQMRGISVVFSPPGEPCSELNLGTHCEAEYQSKGDFWVQDEI